MIKWLGKKFEEMGREDAVKHIDKPIEDSGIKSVITLECDGTIAMRISDVISVDVNLNRRFRIYLDYNVDIYLENDLESIKAKGKIYMTSEDSEHDAYLFMIEQNKNGAKDYMKNLKERVINDYKSYLGSIDTDKLKEMIKQQKPIEVKFTVQV